MPTPTPTDRKRLLDMTGLKRYDTKLKDYVAEEVAKCSLDPIPSSDVEELFLSERTFTITTPSEIIDEELEKRKTVPTVTNTYTLLDWPEQIVDTTNNITYTKKATQNKLQYKYGLYFYSVQELSRTGDQFVYENETPKNGASYTMIL